MTTRTKSPKIPRIPALVTTGKEIAFAIPVATLAAPSSLPAFDFDAAFYPKKSAAELLAEYASPVKQASPVKPRRTNGNALTIASVYDSLVSLGARTKPVTLSALALAYNDGANVAKITGAVYRLRQARVVLARKTRDGEYLTVIADLPAQA